MTAIKWLYAGCAAHIIAIYAFTETWPVNIVTETWRYARIQNEDWWREWISATSGWAGALAAAVTLFALYRQISEQKKQTDFVLGDALPTMDVLEHRKDGQVLVVKIRNWNRRSLIINDITTVDSSYRVGVLEMKINDISVKTNLDPKDLRLHPIEGNVNPNAPPVTASIELSAATIPEDVLVTDWSSIGEIEADIIVVGDRHTSIRLQASTSLRAEAL
jgi:hypothetical protein